MQKWSHFNYAKTFQSKHFNIQTELTTFSGEKSGCCAGSAVDYRYDLGQLEGQAAAG